MVILGKNEISVRKKLNNNNLSTLVKKGEKMRKKNLLIILLLYVSVLSNVNALENGVTIPLVADRMTDNGEEGAFLHAQVIVTNGTGHVFVDTNPYTQVDLQGSARIAAMVASDILELDQKSYDFYYIIGIDSPIIGGPSAGGALTVATIAAINNWTIKPGIAMTGMIDPDETIGPVGGISFKLKAAAARDTTLFLVPQGQLIENATNINNASVVPHIITGEAINLKELGKKLGVTVKEVNTIQDAVLEFTGHDISKPTISKTVFTQNYLDRLQPLALQLRNESESMYKNTSINNDIMINVQDLLEQAKDLQNQADDLVNNKKYYAATSLYFRSMINILTAQWEYQYNQEKDKEQYITNLSNSVGKQIKISEDDLDKFKSNGISDIQVIGAAESRITEANNTLENIKNLNNTDSIISSLAFAQQRARSAQWWLTLAVPSEKVIPEDILKERSGWYTSQAQSIATYVQSLISEGGHPVASVGITTLAQKEVDRGYYSGAIFDSLQAISRLSTVIGLLGVQDPSNRIDQSSTAAEVAINDARSNGIEPTLAVSAYEFAGINTNPFEKMSQYAYAKMVAKTTESIYSHAKLINQTMSTRQNITMQKQKSSGFEGVSLLIIILLIRKRYRL